jgi:PIN domain nuclease of toxin-antitoxin system
VKYLLDTHTWIWLNSAPDRLSEKVRRRLTSLGRDDDLLLSAISLWELCKLAEKGRITLYEDLGSWARSALDMSGLRVIPIGFEIALASTTLPQPFHQDPADQMIVATARLHDATILTKDRLLLDYPHVRSLW